eukprot:3471189-Rhodomonas_salina.1
MFSGCPGGWLASLLEIFSILESTCMKSVSVDGGREVLCITHGLLEGMVWSESIGVDKQQE